MGLVMADAMVSDEVEVRVWGRDEHRIAELESSRRSPRLPGFLLPEAVTVTADPGVLFDGVGLIVNAVPTQFIRSVWQGFGAAVAAGGAAGPDVPAVSVSKGIENDTLLRPTQVIAEATGDDPARPLRAMGALSGPTIAAELARHLPATMVAASTDGDLARRVQDRASAAWLRIYRLDDLVGVEIAGAAKNVIALAAGMIDGLGVGDNAKSALLARGLAEIARLGAALGARIDTFFGVAGVGDLATTCFSPEGRNRRCGEQLGRGEPLDAVLASMDSVVEGVATTRSVKALAASLKVDMPITGAVHGILFEGLSPADAIAALMGREPKAERIG